MGMLISLRNQFLIKKEIQDMIDISIEQSKRKVSKDSETTTKQQILILEYLGVIKQINLDTIKKADLISKLINRNDQNVRCYLTYVVSKPIEESEIKTVENLKVVRKIFEDCGLIKEIKLINNDLKKLGVID